MLKMKVLAIAPEPSDGTAWWRLLSPFGVLREQSGGQFEYDVYSQVDHIEISKCDLLYMQRPVRAVDITMMNQAKSLGIPVVIDYDDDYTNVPANNMTAKMYMQPDVQNNIRTLMTQANVITVSTVELKNKWKHINKNIAVVPNGFDDRMVLKRGAERLPYRRVLWRGSASHNEDLLKYGDAVVKAANEGAPAIWTFVGHSVFHIHSRMPLASVEEYDWRGVVEWFNLLGELRPQILIVPLVDTPFNRQKSNISILEGAWTGAAVLAPDWDDWRAPGVTNYKTPKEFAAKLIELLAKSDSELTTLANETWDAVRQRLLVSRSNKLRMMLFNELCKEAQTLRIKTLTTEPDKLDEILATNKGEVPDVQPVQENQQ